MPPIMFIEHILCCTFYLFYVLCLQQRWVDILSAILYFIAEETEACVI